MIQMMKKLVNNSITKYIFFGGLTTLVNLVTYYILRNFIELTINCSNILSILCAIIFAYFVNSQYVFNSKANTFKSKTYEFIKFTTARFSTMLIEIVGVYIMATSIGINDMLSKILIQIIVLILNFIFSKLFVFTIN